MMTQKGYPYIKNVQYMSKIVVLNFITFKFKVIQGHRIRYQSKAYMRLSISD